MVMRFRKLYRIKDSSPARLIAMAFLAVSLVGAQIAGLEHRIEHAPGSNDQSAHLQALLQHEQDGDHAPAHDCAAYDAAALGDAPPTSQSKSTAAPPPQLLLVAATRAVTDNSPQLPFHSRAPPRA